VSLVNFYERLEPKDCSNCSWFRLLSNTRYSGVA
jgi:hypothetical protein